MANDELSTQSSSLLKWSWCERNNCLEVDAPIELVDAKRGERGISETGKSSKSRFQYLSFDEKSNTSTILCYPLTGRQHQLRVHLHAIGFSIHNDLLYGGEVEKPQQNQMKTSSIEAIEKSMQKDKCHLSLDDFVTEESIKQAKEVSLCCRGKDGIEQSFNDAQLLVKGHAIDLHALAYKIHFERKKRKKSSKEGEKETLAVLDLFVKAPTWADIDVTAISCWLDK